MIKRSAFYKWFNLTYSSLGGWAFIVVLLLLAQNSSASKPSVDKATQALLDEGDSFLKKGSHIDQADSCFALAHSLAIENKNTRLAREALYGRGLVLYNKGDYSASSNILDSLLTYVEEFGQPLHAKILKILGNDLVYLGNYARAYECQLKAFEYFHQQKDTLNMATLHFSIGNNLFYQEQYQLAFEEFNKSLHLWETKNNVKGIYWALGAIGSCYEHLGNLEKAIEFAERSLKLAIQLESQEDIAWTLYIIGSIASTAGELDKAKNNLQEAKKLAIALDDIPLLGYVLEGLTANQIRDKNFHTALKTLDESYEIAERNNDRANIPGLYKLYSEIHFELKHYKTAREYTQKYIALRDSSQNAELASSMGSLKKDFELREVEREQEIALLKKDAKLKSFRVLFWVGAFVMAALAFIFYLIMVRIKNKHNREKNELLIANNQRILQQNEILKSSNRDLKQYAYIISHDLKEPLRNIGSFTNLLSRKLGPTLDQESNDYMGFIKGGVRQMHQLLTDLLEYSKVRDKSKEASSIDTNAIVNEVLISIQTRISSTNTTIKIGKLPTIFMAHNQFFQIILNLITNAIKFKGEESPHLIIDCTEKEDRYVFSIQDNGIGIDPSYHEKIFVVFQRLNNRADYSGSGIGLATCKKIISDYGGNIWIDSEPGHGSTFFFSIPKQPSSVDKSPEQLSPVVSAQLN